jgi:hypothetical protein
VARNQAAVGFVRTGRADWIVTSFSARRELIRAGVRRGAAALAFVVALLGGATPSRAVTPESPEVVAAIDKGLKFLETVDAASDPHLGTDLGAKCLVALAFHKRGLPDDHPRIKEAIEACRASVDSVTPIDSIYSKGLAVIFLAEIDADAHRDLISAYAEMLRKHQMPQGGFTYIGFGTGDTSQTQYAALAYWEMLNHGMSPDAGSVQNCVKWLMRTQDPSGVWGYQGIDPGNYELVEQTSKPGLSMSAAGMGGALILGNAIGLLKPGGAAATEQAASEDLPPALQRADLKERKQPTLPAGNVERQQLIETLERGRSWFDKNFEVQVVEYQSYYLYSVERYKSFEEYLSGEVVEEPQWYNAGYEFLKKTQQADGSWLDNAGPACATAFATLFLLRSTQQSIKASLGEGTLVGGRGLPSDLSKVKIRGGKLVVQSEPTEVDQLLDMLDDSKSGELDALLDDPAALRVGDVGADQARRLQQIVRSGPPQGRLMAVRALSRLRSIDYAPTLIFALTDPDKRVVREARDGLRFVSRNFEGFGPPDNFEEPEQRQAVERWKTWYKSVRPDAPAIE